MKRKYVYGLVVVLLTVIAGALASTCRRSSTTSRIDIPSVDQTEAREAVMEAQAAGEQVEAMSVSLLGAKTDLDLVPQQVEALSPEEKAKEGDRFFR